MTEEERAKLDALSTADRRSAADWIRVAIDDAYSARFSPAKKAKPAKK